MKEKGSGVKIWERLWMEICSLHHRTKQSGHEMGCRSELFNWYA